MDEISSLLQTYLKWKSDDKEKRKSKSPRRSENFKKINLISTKVTQFDELIKMAEKISNSKISLKTKEIKKSKAITFNKK